MNKDYSKYLQFLAAECNVLYIGKDTEDMIDKAFVDFLSVSKVDINKEILKKINSILTKRHINLIIIDTKDNDSVAIDFYNAIKEFNDEILIMLIFDSNDCKQLSEIVSLVDTSISYPIDKNLFYKKLFTTLSCSYAINSIGRRDIILKQNKVTEDSIDKFFDTYEGSVLFIADDLMDMVNSLNDGNLTHNFLIDIADQLDKVAETFSKAKQTSSVSSIYKELSLYLRKLNLNEIEPKNLKGFNYLSEIISDVSVYLMDMFVDRIFKDVYIFEHSLKSNIEFMENALAGNNEDEDKSELDFF